MSPHKRRLARCRFSLANARLGLPFLLALLSGLACSPKIEGSKATAGEPRGLVVSPDPIVLGVLPDDRPARFHLALSNPGPEAVTIERVESSCPCIRADALPVTVPTGGASRLDLTFDPAEEPGFAGALAVDLTGYGAGGAEVFGAQIRLEVGPAGRGASSDPDPIEVAGEGRHDD